MSSVNYFPSKPMAALLAASSHTVHVLKQATPPHPTPHPTSHPTLMLASPCFKIEVCRRESGLPKALHYRRANRHLGCSRAVITSPGQSLATTLPRPPSRTLVLSRVVSATDGAKGRGFPGIPAGAAILLSGRSQPASCLCQIAPASGR